MSRTEEKEYLVSFSIQVDGSLAMVQEGQLFKSIADEKERCAYSAMMGEFFAVHDTKGGIVICEITDASLNDQNENEIEGKVVEVIRMN